MSRNKKTGKVSRTKTKKILVLNCGSSSIKYKLYENDEVLISGIIERIGEPGSRIKDHKQGLRLMIDDILSSGRIDDLREITAVGHRVVHGGEISHSGIITEKIIRAIKKYSKLAPLHNPVNLKGILELKKIMPKTKQVAVFDTAFHQTMPDYAYLYAIPYELYSEQGIRRYGFHGTSHKYVSKKAAHILKKDFNDLNMITCHLGNGCSIAAIKKGKVLDTSMGMTPLEGLVMGTRCGDIDPGVLIYLADRMKLSFAKIDNMLNKQSGLLGISGKSKDMRDIYAGMKKGDKRSKLAYEIFCYRLKKYISAYAGILGNIDAIVFTAGIGENHPAIRAKCTDIGCLGIKLDGKKNLAVKNGVVSTKDSKVAVLVVHVDEEKVIAEETAALI